MERMIRKRERRKKDRSTKQHCRNGTEREKTMKGGREREREEVR